MLQALPAPAQCLFLRLFQRRRHWFRISTLAYTEVPDTSEAVAALTTAGFARTADAPTTLGAQASELRAATLLLLHCAPLGIMHAKHYFHLANTII